jgi:hypothetical protein
MIGNLYAWKPGANQAYHVDATDEATWAIVKILYATPGDQTSSWTMVYPNGSDMPAFIWDNVESYTYTLLAKR